MEFDQLSPDDQQALERVLGYLNFSSGTADGQFLGALNRWYAMAEKAAGEAATWRKLFPLLRAQLARLHGTSAAFRDTSQAAAILKLAEEHLLPGYLEFHRDLLWGRMEEDLFRPFFLGRACEAILLQGAPWDEVPRIVAGALRKLNDYIGHRPVAALESQKIKPYDHEWVRPVPWYVQGAGVGTGKYAAVIEKALELLSATDEHLLHRACFDPKLLDELAVDPRPYDFDHPVNRRPNYHFGQWDPHHIDSQGRYRRFVVQEVTLETLTQRLTDPSEIPEAERLYEAAAVLAGTILMAAGVSGRGPDTYDSSTSLSTLLPKIAQYRDEFYEHLIQRVGGEHQERLRQEAKERKQPFGGARQHLNAQLARRRATQLEHVHLAWVFARMGYPEAARAHVESVAVASARMHCHIECLLTAGWGAIERGELTAAAAVPAEVLDLLRRAIACGAIVDPWNILGFDGHFSLFPSLENSTHDHRVDELIDRVDEILAFFARLWSAAAARDEQELSARVASEFEAFSNWWRQFAAHEVESVKAVDPLEEYRAAEHVSKALNLWHKGGAAAGDIAFWAPHAEMFNSPKAYALVISALLDRGDLVATMALLMHWLNQAGRVPLEYGEDSFARLIERWLLSAIGPRSSDGGKVQAPVEGNLLRKLFDYLEANANEFWSVPSFELSERRLPAADFEEEPARDEDQESLFGAAYEDMVYRDSTDDGFEGEVLDFGSSSHDELEREGQRIAERLGFLACVARLWRLAALNHSAHEALSAQDQHALQHWVAEAQALRQDLVKLLDAVRSYSVTTTSTDQEAMIEYDRKRMAKEALLEQIIATTVEMGDAARVLMAVAPEVACQADKPAAETEPFAPDEWLAVRVYAALIRGDERAVRERLGEYTRELGKQPLLYVPLAKGGQPHGILAARTRQRCIHDLLSWLPRRSFLIEACDLLEVARQMERDHPVGAGAVTEFDELFKIGYEAIVEQVIFSSRGWSPSGKAGKASQQKLVGSLERLTETMLASWLAHSRTLRLSVMEKVQDKQAWKRVVAFIEKYGHDLFTQRFLNLGNLRAILHHGVDAWLTQLAEELHDLPFALLEDLEAGRVSRSEVVENLTFTLEAVVENYSEYRDYNNTTTQSDHGEMLYSLLDFLRLRVKYDRICWNLRPVVWAHEMMVRQGLFEAARLWRRALAERIGDEAEHFVTKLHDLQKKYAMQMSSIADRLSERFLRPLLIDRMRALVEPAMKDPSQVESQDTFDTLRKEAEILAREPSGAGLDTPPWLLALEEEVERIRRPFHERYEQREFTGAIERRPMTLEEVESQIESWSKREP